jgi:hypothetical protein
MRPAPAGHTTKSDFADNHLRCARSLVSKYAKAGRLVLDDSGRFVHVEGSIARIRATAGAPERSKRAILGGAVLTDMPATDPASGPTVFDSTERKKWCEAETAEDELRKSRRKLMEADSALHAVTSSDTELRTTLEEIPAKVAPRLAASREVQEQARLIMTEEIEMALTLISVRFHQMTRGVAQ